ncbi:MAG: DUF3419 family protein [Clostridiales bacterium]|nr:DUF3419 family protein [Clostridiales bacterium]
MAKKLFGEYNVLLEKFINSKNYKGSNATLNKAYAISNEGLSFVFDGMDLTNKKVATVGSSGDQAINAILNGCRDVTIIDGNNYAEAFIEYKLAFIKTFDFKEFKQTFIKRDFFSWRVYAKISHLLSDNARLFWDSVMLEQSEEYGSIFHPMSIKDNMMIIDHRDRDSAFYYEEKTYLKLQQILNSGEVNIQYLIAEFSRFPKVLKEKYDLIYLSNIFDYYDQDNKEKFYRTVQALYKNRLKVGGKIVVNYNFCMRSTKPSKICGEKVETKHVVRVYEHRGIDDELWIIGKTKQKNNAPDELTK